MSPQATSIRPATKHLMDRVLRDGAPIDPEYPLVFGEGFAGRAVELERDGQVVSACALLARELVVGEERLRAGLIGSVVTDPEHRGEGLASEVLARAEAALAADGCAFALLWAEDPAFYTKRGYGPIGVEYDVTLPYSMAQRLPTPSGVRPMAADDPPAMHALYGRHAARVERTLEESQALFHCPRMTTLVRTREGEVVAYACLGRGADFANVIHEWAGATEDLLALVRAHLERLAGTSELPEAFLLVPSSARGVLLAFENLGAQVSRRMLGMGKVLDREAVAAQLTARLAPLGCVDGALDEEPGCTFRVRGPLDLGHFGDDGALALLVGVAEVRLEVDALLSRFGLEGSQLPYEPFLWGLDSI